MTENASCLPPPPAAPRQRVRRSRDDRKIAGVAGGIARHFDLDPSLVRLGFVAFALFGGSGLLFYLIAWLVIPSDDEPRHAAGDAPTPPVTEGGSAADDVMPFTVYPMV